jgi:hypothetical protein
MRRFILPLLVISVAVPLHAQSNDAASEDIVELSPFVVSNESVPAYRIQGALSAAGTATPILDPRSAMMPAPVAISVAKRADAVAIQFVLSHSGDKQEVRNQELYASVGAIESAVKNMPGMRVEQREVRFTGGDRKLFSVSRGGSINSFVSILILADLPPDARVADRVKQVRDILAATKLTGQTKYSDGSIGLYLKNPDQYRREILGKIFEDVQFMKKGFDNEFEIQPSGLNGKVRMRVSAEAEIELWVDYGMTFRSIRELEAPKKDPLQPRR